MRSSLTLATAALLSACATTLPAPNAPAAPASVEVIGTGAPALHRSWQVDDELAYQLLIALGNCGIGRAGNLVRQVAKEGLESSREFARDLVRLGLV
jgi:hypothetical protein